MHENGQIKIELNLLALLMPITFHLFIFKFSNNHVNRKFCPDVLKSKGSKCSVIERKFKIRISNDYFQMTQHNGKN